MADEAAEAATHERANYWDVKQPKRSSSHFPKATNFRYRTMGSHMIIETGSSTTPASDRALRSSLRFSLRAPSLPLDRVSPPPVSTNP